jgi:inner membrane protein
LGVALLWPFSDARFFFPWRPIRTSPLSPSAFFSCRGGLILVNEMLWVWLPVLLLLAIHVLRRRHTRLKSGRRSSP